MKKTRSWNNFPKVKNNKLVDMSSSFKFENESNLKYLPFGNGRSYGDVCLIENGISIDTKVKNKILSFDIKNGILKCESGITFEEILTNISKSGWFLPVVPGTRYITVGGAIANDIHGKNHHTNGSFGNFLLSFELLQSDNSKYICSENSNQKLYEATIGGLGLTGLITWAEIKLIKIKNPYLVTQTHRFNSLEEYDSINRNLEQTWNYTVGWIDIPLKKKGVRGVLHTGKHLNKSYNKKLRNLQIKVPITPPISLINNLSASLINEVYFRINKEKNDNIQHYNPFFFPLDGIKSWNKVYGPKGFFQYQFVVPSNKSLETLNLVFEEIKKAKQKPFLGVIKTFGSLESKGLLSFPRGNYPSN